MSDITDKVKVGEVTTVGELRKTLDAYRDKCPITPLRIYYVAGVNKAAYLEIELIEGD